MSKPLPLGLATAVPLVAVTWLVVPYETDYRAGPPGFISRLSLLAYSLSSLGLSTWGLNHQCEESD